MPGGQKTVGRLFGEPEVKFHFMSPVHRLFPGGQGFIHDQARNEGVRVQRFLFCLFLAACSAQPVVKPVKVEVPVPVPCHAPAVLHPVWPTQALDGQESLPAQIKAFLAENELRQAYESQMEAALAACR